MERPADRSIRWQWLSIVVGFYVLVIPAVAGAAVVTVISPSTPLPSVLSAAGQVHADAAADLCDYLSRVTGRDIVPGRGAAVGAVTIHVGPDAFVLKRVPEIRDLYADGFLLKHVAVDGQHHLVLSGIRLKSSRWAVEEFLGQFAGVRWLFPDTVYGEIVPSMPTVKVDCELNQKHEPYYLSRGNLACITLTRTAGISGEGPKGEDLSGATNSRRSSAGRITCSTRSGLHISRFLTAGHRA